MGYELILGLYELVHIPFKYECCFKISKNKIMKLCVKTRKGSLGDGLRSVVKLMRARELETRLGYGNQKFEG